MLSSYLNTSYGPLKSQKWVSEEYLFCDFGHKCALVLDLYTTEM